MYIYIYTYTHDTGVRDPRPRGDPSTIRGRSDADCYSNAEITNSNYQRQELAKHRGPLSVRTTSCAPSRGLRSPPCIGSAEGHAAQASAAPEVF